MAPLVVRRALPARLRKAAARAERTPRPRGGGAAAADAEERVSSAVVRQVRAQAAQAPPAGERVPRP